MTDYIHTPLMDRPATEADKDALPVGKIAELLAEPGIPAASIATQIRGWGQKHLLMSWLYKGTGRTRANLYTEDQWLVAKVLGLLTELGIADVETLRSASRALSSWHGEIYLKDRPARSPAQFIIDRFRGGEDWWTFEFSIHRHDQTGERVARGRIRNAQTGEGTDYGLPDAYVPRLMLAIDLTPHLVRLFRDRTKGN